MIRRLLCCILNPGDPKAISPAIKKAQGAGIPVVAVDTVAEGADAAEHCSIQGLECARLTMLSEGLNRGRPLKVVSTAGPPSLFPLN
jgi:hypothetical protein